MQKRIDEIDKKYEIMFECFECENRYKLKTYSVNVYSLYNWINWIWHFVQLIDIVTAKHMWYVVEWFYKKWTNQIEWNWIEIQWNYSSSFHFEFLDFAKFALVESMKHGCLRFGNLIDWLSKWFSVLCRTICYGRKQISPNELKRNSEKKNLI